jgi:hypothetical protein
LVDRIGLRQALVAVAMVVTVVVMVVMAAYLHLRNVTIFTVLNS